MTAVERKLIAQAEELYGKATAGKWIDGDMMWDDGRIAYTIHVGEEKPVYPAIEMNEADAAFIAFAHNYMPFLLAIIQRQAAELIHAVILDEGLALAMSAGARSIEQSAGKRGSTYIFDVFGDSKEIPYALAAKALRDIATPFLTRTEVEEAPATEDLHE